MNVIQKRHCTICGKEEATQKHHIKYDPPMAIDVCVSCHLKIHEHGVGLGRGSVAKTITPPEEKELYYPSFTKELVKDKAPYIVLIQNEEVLYIPRCPNDCGALWNVFFSKKSGDFFIRCPTCGFDARLMRTG